MAAPNDRKSPLHWLYLGCGVLAAMFLVALGVLVLANIILRLVGTHVPGLAYYSGYCMAASSFLALAYSLGHGAHIRVGLFINAMRGTRRRVAEIWCLAIGGFFAGYLAWFSIKQVRVSRLIHDISQGADATPLWIPQVAMAVGATVFAIALVDRLIAVLRGAPVARQEIHPEDHE